MSAVPAPPLPWVVASLPLVVVLVSCAPSRSCGVRTRRARDCWPGWPRRDLAAATTTCCPAAHPTTIAQAVQQLTALRALRRRAAALAVTYRVMRAMPADDEIGTGCVAQVALDADAGE